MPVGELEDIVVVGAAEPVNRLGIVTDGREVACPGRSDRLYQLDLNDIGVLHFVDQDVAETFRACGGSSSGNSRIRRAH